LVAERPTQSALLVDAFSLHFLVCSILRSVWAFTLQWAVQLRLIQNKQFHSPFFCSSSEL
jgi:hypothetical protein